MTGRLRLSLRKAGLYERQQRLLAGKATGAGLSSRTIEGGRWKQKAYLECSRGRHLNHTLQRSIDSSWRSRQAAALHYVTNQAWSADGRGVGVSEVLQSSSLRALSTLVHGKLKGRQWSGKRAVKKSAADTAECYMPRLTALMPQLHSSGGAP